mmetsp:Transcript_10082/g.34820  ORF Transcript_10082/g.34820 Transcript_10082/m.34820 type:complete len:201 (-) Transcript_10082:1010-1612(-)
MTWTTTSSASSGRRPRRPPSSRENRRTEIPPLGQASREKRRTPPRPRPRPQRRPPPLTTTASSSRTGRTLTTTKVQVFEKKNNTHAHDATTSSAPASATTLAILPSTLPSSSSRILRASSSVGSAISLFPPAPRKTRVMMKSSLDLSMTCLLLDARCSLCSLSLVESRCSTTLATRSRATSASLPLESSLSSTHSHTFRS